MNNCFIFVEGYYDKMFLENVINPYLVDKNSMNLITIPYQQKINNKINKTIKMASFKNYLFLSDFDSHSYPCISSRKNKRINEYSNLDFSKIIIVKEEIESWFLSGIDTSLNQFKKWIVPENTESITKEDFDLMLKNHNIDSKTDFLSIVSQNFNFDLAVKRNNSFKYFLSRLIH